MDARTGCVDGMEDMTETEIYEWIETYLDDMKELYAMTHANHDQGVETDWESTGILRSTLIADDMWKLFGADLPEYRREMFEEADEWASRVVDLMNRE